jgi:hypothetical protein
MPRRNDHSAAQRRRTDRCSNWRRHGLIVAALAALACGRAQAAARLTESADSVVPRQPVLPLTEGLKPPRGDAAPRKLMALEPGGWPPAVSVPLPAAGGVGVSPLVRTNPTPDGRFQQER